jgi:hypothetical protein
MKSITYIIGGFIFVMGFALPGPGPFFLYAHAHTPLLLL